MHWSQSVKNDHKIKEIQGMESKQSLLFEGKTYNIR